MSFKRRVVLPVILLSSVYSFSALAVGSATSTFTVQANVVNDCTIATEALLNFGNYDPRSTTPDDVSSTVTITCTKGLEPSITLSYGHAGSENRYMQVGSDAAKKLSYQLYQPGATTPGAACAHNTVWGLDTHAFQPGVVSDMNPKTYNICGRIPAGEDAVGGTYTDSITATVNF